jgi:aldose 1-epimerase
MILESVDVDGVTFLKMTNGVGLSLLLSDYGAGLYEVRYLGAPMCIAQKEKKEWLNSDAYFGKTVGRLAGRIAEGKLDYLGKSYLLSVNEGKNTLHGGKEGFSFRFFKMDVVHLGDGVAADFYLTSPALEMGFPGECSLRVRYFLREDEPSFRITYQSKVSEQTPLNFTSHTYFNLGGEVNVEKQKLTVHSGEVETYDSSLIPLGFVKVPPCLDFRNGKAVGQDINDPLLQNSRTLGYDHCFRFLKKADPVKLTLENETYRLDLDTSLPCVQIYSDNYPRPHCLLNTGHEEEKHSGLAVEPVYAPMDYHAMTALPFETKSDYISYHFSKKEN